MKKVLTIASLVAIMASSTVATVAQTLPTAKDSVSYALGMMVGNAISSMLSQVPLDDVDMQKMAEAFASSKPTPEYLDYVEHQLGEISSTVLSQGFTAIISGVSTLMTDEVANDFLNKTAAATHALIEKERKAKADKNAQEGANFLSENAKKKGVTTLPSGLQYSIITKGKGDKPGPQETVRVNYKGSLLDGTVFDETAQPIDLSVDNVIKGWEEALQLMPVGSKWKLYIPSDLAYGERGAGDKIGPNSTLIFEIELLEIIK